MMFIGLIGCNNPSPKVENLEQSALQYSPQVQLWPIEAHKMQDETCRYVNQLARNDLNFCTTTLKLWVESCVYCIQCAVWN
jgi:hypothetical protein